MEKLETSTGTKITINRAIVARGEIDDPVILTMATPLQNKVAVYLSKEDRIKICDALSDYI